MHGSDTHLGNRSQYLSLLVAACGYFASAGILALQLLWYQGAPISWAVIFLFQAIIYALLVWKMSSRHLFLAMSSAALGAWLIGWMPIGRTLATIQALLEHRDIAFSSLTRHMPTGVRVLYELGGFPLMQFVVLACAIIVLRVGWNRRGAEVSRVTV